MGEANSSDSRNISHSAEIDPVLGEADGASRHQESRTDGIDEDEGDVEEANVAPVVLGEINQVARQQTSRTAGTSDKTGWRTSDCPAALEGDLENGAELSSSAAGPCGATSAAGESDGTERRPSVDAGGTSIFSWSAAEKRDFGLFAVVTACYLYYRSRGAPTFDLEPFHLGTNDLWAILFVAAFAVTRRPTYLVFCINPLRNLIMHLLQFTDLDEVSLAAEYRRNAISSFLQLALGLAIKHLVGQRYAAAMRDPGTLVLDRCESGRGAKTVGRVRLGSTVLLCVQGVALVCYGLVKHTNGFTELGENHGWKILVALPLGISEEVSWREVVLDDTGNFIQSGIWGLNHLVVGEGGLGPLRYGIVAFAYAFILGLTQYRVARYLSHVGIEYAIMDNLISEAKRG